MNISYCFRCILYTARCWLPSWENLIYYYLPFLSWERINSIYIHHLSCYLTQPVLIGGLKWQCDFMPNSYRISNVRDELSSVHCGEHKSRKRMPQQRLLGDNLKSKCQINSIFCWHFFPSDASATVRIEAGITLEA